MSASLSLEQAKRWGKLRMKKYRKREGLCLVEGLRLVEAAVESDQDIEALVLTAAYIASGKKRDPIEGLDCPVFLADNKQWKLLSDTVHGQGILAVVRLAKVSEDSEEWGQRILLLDRIQDPGNLGTIIRTAEAFGFHDILLAKGCADPYDSKVLRSSMGDVFNVNLAVWDFDSLDPLKAGGYQCVASALEASEDLTLASLSAKVALIIGNEANGIRTSWLNEADLRVRIRMTGEVESLNAGIAAGILMHAIQENQRIEL